MANRRKEIPSFVSIEVGKVRGIAESMEDAAWARWSKKALDDLTMGCVRNDVDPIVKEVYDKSKNSMDREYQRKKKWYEDNKKSPQDAPNGNAGVDMYDAGNGADPKSPTSCDQFTADGDTREDSLAKPDGSAITRNETRHIDALDSSANHYATRQAKNGDAATREGAEALVSRESGIDAPTTVSNNMRQSAKTRDNSESCRYAPPSCSPEDGNIYDQESSISTDNHQPEGLTGPSHGGSVASLEARESQARQSQRRTGGSSVRGMAKVAQPHVRSRAKNSRCPNSREEFHAFVADNNLHEGLAEEWYAIHETREWVDRDGNPIKDWRGALYNYCTKTEQKRRTA